ncbi:hypothetical protein B0H11DRAFT_2006926 [Mycena galericulata]|nr:hypothetical protein B0H11DRAFT_2049639 [Mycena galericulata]KAJ7493019.1 hypothetical protein B0H11DRAFT_2006926 [Mycena galericulata]
MQQESKPLNLPLELERNIFELAALSRPVLIPKLMLTAWRVKRWLEQLLYRTLTIDKAPTPVNDFPLCTVEVFMRIVGAKQTSLLQSVRNLRLVFLFLEMDAVDMVLSACPNVENLYILLCGELHDSTRSAPPALATMTPRALYCDLADVFAADPFSHPVFSRVTHLQLMSFDIEEYVDKDYWAGLVHLSQLTHLAFDTIQPAVRCKHILDETRSLRALIVMQTPDIYHNHEILADEPRFVMITAVEYQADWEEGILSGNDFWARADKFIANRMLGRKPDPHARYPFHLRK